MTTETTQVGFTIRVSAAEHKRLVELAEAGHRSLAAQARMMLVSQLPTDEERAA